MSVIGVVVAIGIGLTGWIASSVWGARLDNDVQNALAAPENSGLFQLAFRVDGDVEDVVILVCAISFVFGMLCWGPRRALTVVTTVVVAGVLAGLLKQLAVVVPPSGVAVGGASWPSAHASALAGLDVAVLILPRRRSTRWLLGLIGGAYLAIVCLSLVVVRAHQLTDLLGGCLIGGWVFAIVAAVLDPWANRWR